MKRPKQRPKREVNLYLFCGAGQSSGRIANDMVEVLTGKRPDIKRRKIPEATVDTHNATFRIRVGGIAPMKNSLVLRGDWMRETDAIISPSMNPYAPYMKLLEKKCPGISRKARKLHKNGKLFQAEEFWDIEKDERLPFVRRKMKDWLDI